jgi:L-threonylcarbamoyladenylate synthase
VTDPVEDAARAARNGELVVFPTDTVYGIGTRPDDHAATARLFEAKARPRELELPVLVSSTGAAREVATFDPRAELLASAIWPGALTLVLPRRTSSRAWDLGGDPESIGVRVPRHPLALSLLGRTGPLAVTSANRSGEPGPTDCRGLERLFGALVAVYLCEEAPLVGRPSTVVDLTQGEPRVVRAGAVDERTIRVALAG